MQNNKLILLLQALQVGEIKRLEAFVNADYFNKDPDIRQLFAYLRALYPGFPAEQLEKERVFQHLFPGQPYDDKQLRYLMSGLNKLAEHFLALQEMDNNAHQYQMALLEALSQRGLEKSYRQVERLLAQALDGPQNDSGDYFLAQFQWAALKEKHFERQRQRRFDENIQVASDRLDRYYFLHRLRLACAMLDRQTILQANYQLNLSGDWVRHLEQQEFFGEAVIRLYYTIFQALSDENDEAHFFRLKMGLAADSQQIPAKDMRDIYLFSINYCARKIRQGKARYAEEALSLYRTGIAGGILIENGELSPWAFTNVVKLSLRMQQYDDIEPFIKEYAPLLPASFRENALHYNLAELYYYTGRFHQAQEQLQMVAFSDLNYYLGARVLLAKIFYETGAEESLLSLLASFTIFLKRNKEISNDLKHTYLNFCKLLFQVVKQPKARLADILSRIQSTELLTDRNWLETACKHAIGQ
jgi:hypothetical protein